MTAPGPRGAGVGYASFDVHTADGATVGVAVDHDMGLVVVTVDGTCAPLYPAGALDGSRHLSWLADQARRRYEEAPAQAADVGFSSDGWPCLWAVVGLCSDEPTVLVGVDAAVEVLDEQAVEDLQAALLLAGGVAAAAAAGLCSCGEPLAAHVPGR